MCNPYVLTGYKRPTSFYRSFISAFEWHNETLNIHTHLWPGLIFVYWLFSTDLSGMSLESKFTLIFGYIGAITCMFTSVFFHTVLHVNSYWLKLSLNLDYVGIIAVNLGHQLLNTLILVNGNPILFWPVVLCEFIFATKCAFDIIKKDMGRFWATRHPVITSITTIIVLLLRNEHPAVYYSTGCSIFVIVAGSLFFIGRVPERCLKGFDYYNSHVFHHICVVLGIISAIGACKYIGDL